MKKHIYESSGGCVKSLLFFVNTLWNKNNCYVVEPFHTYHHEGKFRFYPHSIPRLIKKFLTHNPHALLLAAELQASTHYGRAADKAAETIEQAYPFYQVKFRGIIQYVVAAVGSRDAEFIFKKYLCGRIAEFYSAYFLMQGLAEKCNFRPALYYPAFNTHYYEVVKRLLLQSNLHLTDISCIRFPLLIRVIDRTLSFFTGLQLICFIGYQVILNIVIRKKIIHAMRKKYLYGVALVSERQLYNTQRGPLFFLDGQRIKKEDVIIFDPTHSSKSILSDTQGSSSWHITKLPRDGISFHNAFIWLTLFYFVGKDKALTKNILEPAIRLLRSYFRWRQVLQSTQLKHFISHADFSEGHIGRNLALHAVGTQTWYFTDSANSGCNSERSDQQMRHPFWTYLLYNHFVTWSEFLVSYYKAHPVAFSQYHVVGCLWADHILNKIGVPRKLDASGGKNFFCIVVYDSTYSRNGMTSYDEGLLFAKHILRLLDQDDSLFVYFKEKKSRHLHHQYDEEKGQQLADLYSRMDKRSSDLKFIPYNEDATVYSAYADLVISFPFTSTTFETLSTNRPAIWHDPSGYYRDTPFAQLQGVTTHSFEALQDHIRTRKRYKDLPFQNPIPLSAPLLDPYRDGKAIERFRNLLTNY